MPSTQQYSRAQQNRRNEQRRLRRARRNETLKIVAEIHVMEGVAGDKLMSNMYVRHDNARPKSTYVRSPNMSTFISQFWELPLLLPECNEEQRAFTLDARNDIRSSTPHNGLPTSSFILLPHANTAVLSCSKVSFPTFIAISRHIPMKKVKFNLPSRRSFTLVFSYKT